MIVSDHFTPSGPLGDARIPGSVTQSTTCPSRAPSPVGTCYAITYTPANTSAGFYWEYPDKNLGLQTGLAVAEGATKLTFWAKGGAGGEAVTFGAGGGPPAGIANGPYGDTFSASQTITLTTAWAEYTIPLNVSSYGPVLSGFDWWLLAKSTDTLQFSIDSIEWVQ
jgi:hypothetical protein